MVPTLKPILVPLDAISSFQHVNYTTQLGVSKGTGAAVSHTVHVNDKDVKQRWSQGWSLRNATCLSSPLGHWDIDPTLWVQPSRQFFPTEWFIYQIHISPGQRQGYHVGQCQMLCMNPAGWCQSFLPHSVLLSPCHRQPPNLSGMICP